MVPQISPVYGRSETLALKNPGSWDPGSVGGTREPRRVPNDTWAMPTACPRAPSGTFPAKEIEDHRRIPRVRPAHARERNQKSARDSQLRPSRASRGNPKSRQGYSNENTVYFTTSNWWRFGAGVTASPVRD